MALLFLIAGVVCNLSASVEDADIEQVWEPSSRCPTYIPEAVDMCAQGQAGSHSMQAEAILGVSRIWPGCPTSRACSPSALTRPPASLAPAPLGAPPTPPPLMALLMPPMIMPMTMLPAPHPHPTMGPSISHLQQRMAVAWMHGVGVKLHALR